VDIFIERAFFEPSNCDAPKAALAKVRLHGKSNQSDVALQSPDAKPSNKCDEVLCVIACHCSATIHNRKARRFVSGFLIRAMRNKKTPRPCGVLLDSGPLLLAVPKVILDWFGNVPKLILSTK